MDLPIKFPDPHEERVRRCAEFQRLSPDERWRQLMDVVEAGLVLVQQSPHRAAIDRVSAEREAEWRRIQREWFARHGV